MVVGVNKRSAINDMGARKVTSQHQADGAHSLSAPRPCRILDYVRLTSGLSPTTHITGRGKNSRMSRGICITP